MDIWGPYSVNTVHGHRYFLTIVDDHSRFTWVHLMKHKLETQLLTKQFVKMVDIQFGHKVKVIRSDNGLEFLMSEFYATQGILHQTSCRETPQQNARVERKHQHILSVARALLFQASLPKKFWGYAVLHAVFLINRVSSAAV